MRDMQFFRIPDSADAGMLELLTLRGEAQKRQRRLKLFSMYENRIAFENCAFILMYNS